MTLRRSPLARRTPLARSGPPRRRRKAAPPAPGREDWKQPRWGSCAVCGAVGYIVRHHILYERKIREAGRLELVYDLRNALDIGAQETCSCHHDQHWAVRRIPLALIPECAREFAVDVLGRDPAKLWFRRYYGQPRDLRAVRLEGAA